MHLLRCHVNMHLPLEGGAVLVYQWDMCNDVWRDAVKVLWRHPEHYVGVQAAPLLALEAGDVEQDLSQHPTAIRRVEDEGVHERIHSVHKQLCVDSGRIRPGEISAVFSQKNLQVIDFRPASGGHLITC